MHSFNKNSAKDNIPLKLPDLQIANKIIDGTFSIKFLGEILDENITWKYHIHTIEKKIGKKYWFTLLRKTVTNWRIL